MKRNNTLRIAIVLLALVLVSSIGMAGTLARYVDVARVGSATVRAGLWQVRVGAETTTATTTFTLPVGTLSYHGAAAATARIGDHSDNLNILIPGSSLQVGGNIEVFNFSEVPADISLGNVTVSGLATSANLRFGLTLDEARGATPITTAAALQTALADAVGGAGSALTIPANTTTATNVPVSFFVYWPFQLTTTQDEADTVLGSGAADLFTVTVSLYAEQGA